MILGDDQEVLLAVTAVDDDALARIQAGVLDPWLESEPLVTSKAPHDGELELVVRRGDDEGAELDALDDDERCERFVREVAGSGVVWGLYGETWARSDVAGKVEALPFWYRREHAARCLEGRWEGFVPRSIELDAFLEQWLVGMHEDGIVGVLVPTPGRCGAIVSPAELAESLRATRDGMLDRGSHVEESP